MSHRKADHDDFPDDFVSLMALLRAAQQFNPPAAPVAKRAAPTDDVIDFADDFVSLLTLLRTAEGFDPPVAPRAQDVRAASQVKNDQQRFEAATSEPRTARLSATTKSRRRGATESGRRHGARPITGVDG